jgi:hypothetical protein
MWDSKWFGMLEPAAIFTGRKQKKNEFLPLYFFCAKMFNVPQHSSQFNFCARPMVTSSWSLRPPLSNELSAVGAELIEG